MTASGLPSVSAAALARVKGRSRAATPKIAVALRRGKWMPEEEDFTNGIVEHFRAGVLPLEEETTLRTFLSCQLHCALCVAAQPPCPHPLASAPLLPPSLLSLTRHTPHALTHTTRTHPPAGAPMRITKKFARDSSIGKQAFRRAVELGAAKLQESMMVWPLDSVRSRWLCACWRQCGLVAVAGGQASNSAGAGRTPVRSC